MKRILFLIGMYVYLLSSSIYANQKAESFLIQSNDINSSIYMGNDIVTSLQSVSTVLINAKKLNITLDSDFEKNALSLMRNVELNNTYVITSKIILNTLYNGTSTSLVSSLFERQNNDGGFGEFFGFNSTVTDTSIALEAIESAYKTNDERIGYAINYLLNAQHVNGSWGEGVNNDSIYLTARAMHTLWLYRNQYNLASQLERAKTYLESQKDGQLWGELHQSAQALIAIAPMYSSADTIQDSLNAINLLQKTNGSWEDDPYTTALLLRAITIATLPVPNPDLGAIKGIVIDADTTEPISNVDITLKKETKSYYLTDDSGLFEITDLEPGQYELIIGKNGYNMLVNEITLQQGQQVDFGTLHLSKYIAPTSGAIQGRIVDGLTKEPLIQVQVKVGDLSTFTDADGTFSLNTIPVGPISVSFEKDGYANAIAKGESVVGVTSLYSVEMVPVSQVSSGFNLTVVDALNGQVISDVNLSLSGAMNQELHNTGEGIFVISPINDGSTTFTISTSGYATQTLVTTLHSEASYQHTVKMQPINKSVTLSGKVQSNNAAIANVKVSIPELGLSTNTNMQGNFNFANLESGVYTIEFSHPSYFDVNAKITLREGTNYQLPITLYPTKQTEPIIEGHLVDIQTGSPIVGEIFISGDFSATIMTDSAGYYSYIAPNEGNVTLSIVSAGYLQKNENIQVPPTGIVSLRHELYATTLNPSKLRLHLIEAISKNAMNNVDINFYHSGYKGKTTTDSEGNIEINQIIGSSVVIDVDYLGYEKKHIELELFEGEERDYGTVSLFKLGITKLQPDLIIKEATYQENNISISVENQGTAFAVPSTLVAFYDNNANSQYDKQIDTLILKKAIPVSLQAYKQYDLSLENNISNDKKMPISLQVDPENLVLENNESNNFILLCHEPCEAVPTTYTSDEDFSLGKSINVKALASHQLQLDEEVQTFDVIWVSSSGTGTIVKINTKTGEILGEYRSAPSGRLTNPSRTTVDKNGNVWAGNRDETSGKGSIVKIGLVENGQCIDRNGNGIIDTSTGLNDIKPWTNSGGVDNNGGVSTAEDECILHYVRVGGTGVRHVSVDAENNVWVGGYSNRVFNVIDGKSGEILQSFQPSCGGYGGLIDKNNVVWSASPSNASLLRYDTKNTLTDLSDDTYSCQSAYGSYGLGLDSFGNVWNSSYLSNHIYKFASDGTIVGNYPTGSAVPSGLTIGLDDSVWIANRSSASVTRLDNNGTHETSIYVGSSPTGAATDSQGKIWVSVFTNDKFVRIDPSTNQIDLEVKLRSGASPYNYSDMTGSLLSGKPDSGTWSVVKDGKSVAASWGKIYWDGYIPDDAKLKVSVATSDDNISFGSAQLLSNGDLVNLKGRYLKLTVNFERSTNGKSPVLYNISVEPQVKDYSISDLQILDNSESYNISVNVYNLGSVALEATRVHFFNGDSKNGGTLLGVADVPTLAINGSSNITLTGIENIGENNIFAIVDYTMEINECDEDNNIISTPFGSSNVLGNIEPHTDKLIYGVDENVLLYANITNPGRLNYELRAQLVLEDIDGNVVHTFEMQNLGVIASKEIKSINATWNTEKILTGTYKLKGMLYDTENNIVDESYTTFTIASGVSVDALLRLQTDKTTYNVTDTIEIEDVVKNLTTNALLPQTTLHITVKDSAAQVVYDETLSLKQLAPQAMQTVTNYFNFTNLAQGDYIVEGSLETANGDVLAYDSENVHISTDITRSLAGNIQVDIRGVEAGIPIAYTTAIANMSNESFGIQTFKEACVGLDTNETIKTVIYDQNITVDLNLTKSGSVDTTGLDTGMYACSLQVLKGNEWEILDYTAFYVTKPPIEMDYNLSVGTKGRLLVLLDEALGNSGCKNLCDDVLHHKKNQCKDNELDYSEPYGPKEAPTLDVQRIYLEALLSKNDYAYTIVESAEAFEQEFRSGNYNVYLLLQERVKLSEQLQSELREAVYRGEGLLVAGMHDKRDVRVDDALGIKIDSATTEEKELQMIFDTQTLPLSLGDKKFAIELKNAHILGIYKEDNSQKKKFHDKYCAPHAESAVSYNLYYKGKAIFVGFDLLVYASMQQTSAYESLFTRLLHQLQLEELALQTNGVIPIHLELINKGIATSGQTFTKLLNANATIVDTGDAVLNVNNDLVWDYTLAENNSTALDFWMKLPSYATYIELQTDIYTGDVNNSVFYESFIKGFDVTDIKTLDDVIADMQNIKGFGSLMTLHTLQKAKQYEERGKYDRALQALLLASEQLSKSEDEESQKLRYEIALIIKRISKEVK